MPKDFIDNNSTLVHVRQQAITFNVDPDLCRRMVSVSHNELTDSSGQFTWVIYVREDNYSNV